MLAEAAGTAEIGEGAPPSARRQATRTQLLEAATEVFAEAGVQGASVEAICARAGFTRGAFYSNFTSKEQLFVDLLEREFDRRARYLRERALEMEPLLIDRAAHIDPAEAAGYIVDFFAPEQDATAWFVLETEFLLLAMRDPSIAPGYHDLLDRFYAGISGAVERIVAAAGRRFTLPPERAVEVLGGVYERTLRAASLVGPGSPTGGSIDEAELGDRLAELLFAITEEREQTPDS